jgi:hypothetical protein
MSWKSFFDAFTIKCEYCGESNKKIFTSYNGKLACFDCVNKFNKLLLEKPPKIEVEQPKKQNWNSLISPRIIDDLLVKILLKKN